MKKNVCLIVVLALAVSVNAGTITGVSTGTATPDAAYVYDPPRIGDDSLRIVWDSEPESGWGGGHRDVGQNFMLDTEHTGLPLTGFAFRMDPRGGETSAYMPMPSGPGREIKIELYELSTGTNGNFDYGLSAPPKTSWTGMVTSAMVNGSAAESWVVFQFGEVYSLDAGVLYGIKIGWTEMVGTSIWDGGFISYGIFGTEVGGNNWAVYTGGDDQHYHKTWSGRYALLPEPATLALLSLGGLLLRRRK